MMPEAILMLVDADRRVGKVGGLGSNYMYVTA